MVDTSKMRRSTTAALWLHRATAIDRHNPASTRFAVDLHDPFFDQPIHRFAHGLDRAVAGPIVEHARRLGEAAIRAVCDVIVSLRGLDVAVPALPFLPRRIA